MLAASGALAPGAGYAQTISSAQNQVFTVDNPPTPIATITITDASPTPTIKAIKDIRIRIPAGFNMSWDTGDLTATIGGGAASKVSTTVSYEDGGQTLVLDVTANFAAGDQITVSGLSFMDFTGTSPADNLELEVLNNGQVAAVDDKTITISAPTLSSAANQSFMVGDPPTAISTITVTDAAGSPRITATNDIRIRIPAGFNMTWDTGDLTATIGGGAAGKVSSAVSYEDGGQTLVVDVTTDFAAGDQITIADLSFASFTAVSAADNLELEVANDGSVIATDDKTIEIVPAPAPTISSQQNKTMIVGQLSENTPRITITDDAGTPTITAADDIRIRIPAGFNMTWDTGIVTVSLLGSAAGKVSTSVSYEDGGQTLVLDVTADFAAGDQVEVDGLKYANITAPSPADNLELEVNNDGVASAYDDKTITIVAPTLSSATNQTFAIGDPPTAIATLTITEDATTATIIASQDIRIRIPAGFSMTWDTGDLTATLGGSAAGKVSTTVSYEDGGRTLVLDVTSNFAAGDQLTVADLSFASFSATSAADNLELLVRSGAGVTAFDDKTIAVAGPTLSSAANQAFITGSPPTAIAALTIAEDAAVPGITAANDLRIRIPAGFNMTWQTGDLTASLGGSAAGKVSSTVSYEDGGQTLVLDVTSDFAAGEQLTVADLSFASFTAASPADNLELEVRNDGVVTDTDDKTVLIAAPTISSATNQSFMAGDPPTAIATITVTEDAVAPGITAANDLRIRIPSGFNMTWETSDVTATLGGSAAGKVSSTVSYEDGGLTLVLDVTSDFAAGEQLTISDLSFANFSAASPADNLELVVAGAGGATAATDDKTITVAAPTLSSNANQSFTVGDPLTAIAGFTVADDAGTPTITAANDIRIRIPAGFNMIWDTSDLTASLGGSASSKVSTTVSYEDGGKTLVLDVTADFAAGDQVNVTQLGFASFTAASPADNLELVVSGPGGATAATDDKTITVVAPSLSSAANQSFTVGDPPTAISQLTITEDATATGITAANDLRIRIPTGFNMTWDTGDLTATLGGGAAGKVSSTVSYEDGGQTLVLDVTSDFAAGEQLTVSDLSFANFSAASPADNLELVVSGAGGGTAATDDKTITVVAPSLSSAANQSFVVADPPTAIVTATVTDHAAAPTITAANDLRIRIPTGFNMTWETSDVTATLGGSAASKISSTVSYEDGGLTLVLDVTSDFAAGEQLTISDLSFANFTAATPADNLELVVAGAGGSTAATDDKTIAIGQPSLSSAADQSFVVADPPTAISQLTITEDAAAPGITATNDLRIRIPSGFNMAWETSDVTATLGGSAASKVSNTVSYEDGGRTLVLDVTTDFGAGEWVQVSALSFANFTATSPADNLELVVSGAGGATAATDDKTISVVAPTLSAAANQSFEVGDPPTGTSQLTITDDAATPTITAAGDIRIRIPTGFNMTWDAADLTAAFGGPASLKVSSTVSYEDGGRTLVLDVTSDFAAGDRVTVSALSFANFAAPSGPDNLELVVAGAGGPTVATDDKTVTIVAAPDPVISSAAYQNFVVGDPPTPIATITVTDAGTPTITAANDIRIRIPAGFGMTWDTGDVTATLGGGAAGKVSTTVSYEDGGQTLVLDALVDFASGDWITISDLSYANFTAASDPDSLELEVYNDGTVVDTDDKTVAVVPRPTPLLTSAANQVFTVGDPPTAMANLKIIDDPVPTIIAADDIRVRIPGGFNMTWDTTDVTVIVEGSASNRISSTVSYEDAGQTLVLDVTSNFRGNQWIRIRGLSFANFSAASAADNLELEVYNDGTVIDFDDKTIEVTGGTFAVAVTPDTVAASRLPSNGTNYTADLTVTNSGTATDDYDLLTSTSPGGTTSVVSITGSGVTQAANPDSARLSNLAAGDSAVVTVTYSVADVPLGTLDTLFLVARSVGSPATSDDGRLELTVTRPDIITAKAVNPSGTQVPGTDLTYTITITNAGSEEGVNVVTVDSLATEVEFKLGSVVNNLPAGVGVTVEYSDDNGATWTYTPVSAGCSAPAGYDACVTHVRWSLQNNLPYSAPDNTGDVQFVARIR